MLEKTEFCRVCFYCLLSNWIALMLFSFGHVKLTQTCGNKTFSLMEDWPNGVWDLVTFTTWGIFYSPSFHLLMVQS